MKLFSWAAVVFLPPTLIAGIYGMNFKLLPELNWLFGYPWRSPDAGERGAALTFISSGAAGFSGLVLEQERGGVGGGNRDRVDRVGRVLLGRRTATTCERRISQRQLAGDLDTFALVLVEAGGMRLGGAAAEIFAVMGHAVMSTPKR